MQNKDRMHALADRIDAGLDEIWRELGFDEIEAQEQHLLSHFERRIREVSDE